MSPSRTPRLWLAIILMAAMVGALLYALSTQRTRTIFESASEFGRVRVTEQSDGLRSLYTGDGRARQSAIYPGRPLQLVHEYTRVGMIGLALAPVDARILFVGLGGGAMPMFTRQVLPRAHIDAVEIDPVIVDAAQRWFGFVPDDRMTVHTGDGRSFIEAAPAGTYDLVVLDAFSDDEVPYALTTREFLRAVRSSMAPRGVVISNLWTAQPSYAAMLATYADVFDHINLLRVPGRAQRILIASMQSRPLDHHGLIEAARALESTADLGFPLTSLVQQGHEPLPSAGGTVLLDRESTP